ncbi:MAG TPA: helix-turn-helix transcriptional regulator [Chthonomonadaceae bacterium]|nr:helix-turn-helix transcriptional regulator [Chthonomonadaceae bacterium]
MAKERQDEQGELLKGNTPTLLMAVLQEGPLHGYAIAREIERRSGDALQLGEGSLYPALRALERDGLVISRWEPRPSGPARKVYELTEAGHRALAARTQSWRRFVEAVENVLGETPHVQQPT